VGVLRAAGIEMVLRGDASVLMAHDLEYISLVDSAKALFVAGTSLGELHVFILEEDIGQADPFSVRSFQLLL
jgi:hypothetical protein